MAHSHNFRITTIRLVWSHRKSVQPSDFSSTIFSGTKVTCLVQCDHFAPVWCDVMTIHQQSAKTLKEGYFCTITHVKLMFVQPFHPRLLWHYWIVTALCVIVTSHQTRAIPPAWSKNVCWGKKILDVLVLHQPQSQDQQILCVIHCSFVLVSLCAFARAFSTGDSHVALLLLLHMLHFRHLLSFSSWLCGLEIPPGATVLWGDKTVVCERQHKNTLLEQNPHLCASVGEKQMSLEPLVVNQRAFFMIKRTSAEFPISSQLLLFFHFSNKTE